MKWHHKWFHTKTKTYSASSHHHQVFHFPACFRACDFLMTICFFFRNQCVSTDICIPAVSQQNASRQKSKVSSVGLGRNHKARHYMFHVQPQSNEGVFLNKNIKKLYLHVHNSVVRCKQFRPEYIGSWSFDITDRWTSKVQSVVHGCMWSIKSRMF